MFYNIFSLFETPDFETIFDNIPEQNSSFFDNNIKHSISCIYLDLT
jgi:hypothetical protein